MSCHRFCPCFGLRAPYPSVMQTMSLASVRPSDQKSFGKTTQGWNGKLDKMHRKPKQPMHFSWLNFTKITVTMYIWASSCYSFMSHAHLNAKYSHLCERHLSYFCPTSTCTLPTPTGLIPWIPASSSQLQYFFSLPTAEEHPRSGSKCGNCIFHGLSSFCLARLSTCLKLLPRAYTGPCHHFGTKFISHAPGTGC